MSPTIHQPHDKFFKLSMGNLPVAIEFFQTHLPPEILSKIDLSTLELEKHSFIDEAFKSTEADVVYSVKMGDAITYLYILCEHQTEVDSTIAFRLLVYTGEAPWDAPLDIFPLFGEAQALAREWFLKPYQLLDVHRMTDEQLHQHPLSGLVEFALKYRQVRDVESFLETLLPWVHEIEIQQSHSSSLVKIVIHYVIDNLSASNNNVDVFLQKTNQYLSTALRGEVMTLAELFEQRGEQRGLEGGVQQGIERGIEQGLEQGLRQGKIVFVIRMLKYRFGDIPAYYMQRIEQADMQTLFNWGEKILDACSLDDVFAAETA